MSNQELFQALNLFTSGVQSFQRSRSINEANEAVAALRAQELNETEKNLKLGEIAQNLTFSLSRQGMNVQEARGLSDMIMPQANQRFYQSLEQALLSDDPVKQKIAQDELNRRFEQKDRIAGAQLDLSRQKAEAVQGRFETSNVRGVIEKFNSEPGVKGLKENLATIDVQQSQLSEVEARLKGLRPDDTAERTSITLVQAVIARLASDQRLSDQMREEAKLSQAWFNRFAQASKALVSENPTNRDVKVGLQLLRQLESAMTESLDKRANEYTKTSLPTIRALGLTPVEFRETIRGREGLGAEGLSDVERQQLNTTPQAQPPQASPTQAKPQERQTGQGFRGYRR